MNLKPEKQYSVKDIKFINTQPARTMNYFIKVENQQGNMVEMRECNFITDCVTFCKQLARNNPYKQFTVKLMNSGYQLVKVFKVYRREGNE